MQLSKYLRASTPVLAVTAAVGLALAPDAAFAGTSGSGDFDSIWDTLVDWSQGSLGRVIALAFIIVGLVRGIAAQSIMAFALGVGAGLGLYNAETIVDSLFGASVEVMHGMASHLPVGAGIGIGL